MKWTKIEHCWECVFVNAPFAVRVWENGTSHLFFTFGINRWLIHTYSYSSVNEAKADVNNFILNYLALYSAQVHRECLEANVMTWRKLREQLDQIPEDQLDEAIRVLDSDNDWVGEPEIIKTERDMFCDEVSSQDVSKGYLVVDKGHYYLSIDL